MSREEPPREACQASARRGIRWTSGTWVGVETNPVTKCVTSHGNVFAEENTSVLAPRPGLDCCENSQRWATRQLGVASRGGWVAT